MVHTHAIKTQIKVELYKFQHGEMILWLPSKFCLRLLIQYEGEGSRVGLKTNNFR